VFTYPHGYNKSGSSVDYLVRDLFEDTDGTLLTSHTPNTDVESGGWSNNSGSIEIVSNNAEEDAYTTSISTIDSGKSDVVITANGQIYKSGTAPSSSGGVVLRFSDTSNYWVCRVSTYATNPYTWAILEMNGGSLTSRASQQGVTGGVNKLVSNEMIITASGSGIRFEVPDEGVDISYNSATHNQTETKHGIRLYRAASSAYTAIVHDIAITE